MNTCWNVLVKMSPTFRPWKSVLRTKCPFSKKWSTLSEDVNNEVYFIRTAYIRFYYSFPTKNESSCNNSWTLIVLLLNRSYNSVIWSCAILVFNRFVRSFIPLFIWIIKSWTVSTFFRMASIKNQICGWLLSKRLLNLLFYPKIIW